MDSTTGQFTWTPTAVQAQTTYTITVKVTDDGVPPLSDSGSFAVLVTAGLRINSIALVGETLTLAWDSVPGKTYQMQRADSLMSGSWTDLGAAIQAADPMMEQTVAVGTGVQEFYRVVQLD
jgi:hypothetical protein